MISLVASLAIALYGIAWTGEYASLDGRPRSWTIPTAWLAALLHGLAIWHGLVSAAGVDFSFFNALALSSLLVVLLNLATQLGKPCHDKLGLVAFPLAAALLGLRVLEPASPHLLRETSLPMQVHILTSLLAFGLFTIAAIEALLLAAQEHHLRAHRPMAWIRALPPMQAMERLLFQLLGGGVGLLSLSLVTGVLFVDDLAAQHLAHKTVLSVLAWLVFAGLLFGRRIWGWRGRTAIRWTLAGFAVLALAYFGSKLVLELILQRI